MYRNQELIMPIVGGALNALHCHDWNQLGDVAFFVQVTYINSEGCLKTCMYVLVCCFNYLALTCSHHLLVLELLTDHRVFLGLSTCIPIGMILERASNPGPPRYLPVCQHKYIDIIFPC
jgi:hypothetical protein